MPGAFHLRAPREWQGEIWRAFPLWCMLKEKPLSMAWLCIDNWKRQVKQTKGPVFCGGMVTAIADYLGIPTVDIPIVQEYRGLHYLQLLTMHFLSQTGDGLHLRMSNGDTFLLRCPELTHVTDWEFRDNWWMHTNAHMALMRALRGGPGTRRMTQRHVRPDQRVLNQEERIAKRREAERLRRQHQQTEQETAEGAGDDGEDEEMREMEREIDMFGGGEYSSHRTTGDGSTGPDWGQFYEFMGRMDVERLAQAQERITQAEYRQQQRQYQEEERVSRAEYQRL